MEAFMTTLQQRAQYIRQRIVLQGDCWVYPTERRAYLTVDGKPQLVYRIMYQANFGPIPKGLNILHTCDNGYCCNPGHMQVGTQRENVLQAVERKLVESSSPVPGISWQSTRKRWLVMPRINGRKTVLYAGKDFFEAVCALKAFQSRNNTPTITPA